jgi:2'-5' RNA ligase superfamily
MGHAVELLFDPATEAAIKGLWARLETAGLPSLASRTHRRHRPHISLAVAERIDTGRLQDARDCLAATYLDVTLYAPAVFPGPGVLYLSVVPTLALLRLHEEVHAALRNSIVRRCNRRGGHMLSLVSATSLPPRNRPHNCSTCGLVRSATTRDSTALGRRSMVRMRPVVRATEDPTKKPPTSRLLTSPLTVLRELRRCRSAWRSPPTRSHGGSHD